MLDICHRNLFIMHSIFSLLVDFSHMWKKSWQKLTFVNIINFWKLSLDTANFYVLWGMKLSFVTDLVCWHLCKHLTIWCQVLPFEQFHSAYFNSNFLVSYIPLRPCPHLMCSSSQPELDPAIRRNIVSLFDTKHYWKRKLSESNLRSTGAGDVCSWLTWATNNEIKKQQSETSRIKWGSINLCLHSARNLIELLEFSGQKKSKWGSMFGSAKHGKNCLLTGPDIQGTWSWTLWRNWKSFGKEAESVSDTHFFLSFCSHALVSSWSYCMNAH